jgi:radical SAM superfamily enzyme YgiQ (UPF0313 family)
MEADRKPLNPLRRGEGSKETGPPTSPVFLLLFSPSSRSPTAMTRKLATKVRNLLSQERRILGDDPTPVLPASKGWLSVALAYPNRYYTAMSNLGFQMVFQLFNQETRTVCHRVFLPDPEDWEEYRRTETSLFAWESLQPVRSFDLLAFSISYENDYPHVLQMLALGNIPPRRTERGEKDPWVMAGGASILMNPEPLADFVDFFFIGEAEDTLSSLVAILREGQSEKRPRQETLAALARLEGLYVPQFYEVAFRPDGTIDSFRPRGDAPPRVKRVWLRDLNRVPAVSPLLTPHTEFSEMVLTELTRGCPRQCRFCAGCYAYFPYRVRQKSAISEAIGKTSPPAARIGLVGAALSDYPDLLSLGHTLLESARTPSFSSLRIDAMTSQLADLLWASGQRTVTLAPEAGSERMRRIIRKGFEEEAILRAVGILAERGFMHFRLYFMIGLPWERMEDVKAIIDLTKRICHHIRKMEKGKRRGERIALSLNSFVPKPTTPFQWHPFESARSLQEKIRLVKEALRKEPGVTVTADLPKWAYLQAVLCRGDRRVGKLLWTAQQLGGNWAQTYRAVDVNADFYAYRPRSREEVLPWDFIDHGVPKEFLWREYQEALRESLEG